MIILFSNHTYGRQFARAFLAYCQEYAVTARLVFSVFYGDQQKHAQADAFIQDLKQTLRAGDCIQIEKAEVNGETFLTSLMQYQTPLHGVVAGFNQIFKAPLLSHFHSLVNIHPSLLPYYRGPVPSYWVIANGERYTGFSLVTVGSEIDRGDILYQEVLEIAKDERPDTLDQKIASRAVPIMTAYLRHLAKGEDFASKTEDAQAYLLHHVDYLSFPDKEPR